MTAVSLTCRPACEGVTRVLPFLNPRAADLVLGLAIGLSLALAWHWVTWTIR